MRDRNGVWLRIGDPVEIEIVPFYGQESYKSKIYEVTGFDDANIKIITSEGILERRVSPAMIRKLEIEELI